MSEPYYITTAIAYPNGDPHVGHAYEYIATDAIARFKRLDGFDVRYLTGTDVHGLKMAETAAAEGIPTAELARRNSDVFQRLQEKLNISFDRFIRTSDADHYEASKEIWRRMNEAGDIYLDTYAGWYSVRDEGFVTEAETSVGPDGVRVATETGAPVTWTEEQTYFFRLSAYADKLLAHYEAHPEFIEPDVRRNEVVSFVSGGLRDFSISRTTFDWGVPVPDHPDHVMYVWVDALTNYLTGVGFPDTDSELFKRFWPADLHMIGKDIIRFHTVYWPAFLMSAGIELPRTGFRARLPAQQRREDEQVGRQRRSTRTTWSTPSGWTRCAISCCARCRSGRTAATAKRRSSVASTPTWPTSWATWRSARCRWSPRTSTESSRSRANSPPTILICLRPPTG